MSAIRERLTNFRHFGFTFFEKKVFRYQKNFAAKKFLRCHTDFLQINLLTTANLIILLYFNMGL